MTGVLPTDPSRISRLAHRLYALIQEFYEALTEDVSEADLAAFLSAGRRMVDNYDAMWRRG